MHAHTHTGVIKKKPDGQKSPFARTEEAQTAPEVVLQDLQGWAQMCSGRASCL